MKRLLSVCFAMIITFALLTAACAEGIDNTLDTVAEEQEILSGMIEPEVSESEDLALTGDSASTDVQSQEVQASEDHAVSAPMPKAGNCAHKKYSKINGAYKHYTQVDSKKHSVTSYAPDPSIYPEATFYFVKCDACSETGFWYKDEWEHRITWESENEAFYYEYSLFCNRSEYTEAHTFANGRCSKCGCKGSDTITVKLSARSVTLGEKETFKLSATVKPSGKGNSLRYYSSNTKAATVDSKTGKITAKKAGTATIKAKIDSKTLATCKVTVKTASKDTTVPIDKSHFPDKTFRSYVQKSFDKNKDGTLSSKEILEAKDISCQDEVTSMKGIEHFIEAMSIYCTGMYELKSLDLRKNTKLKKLELNCCTLGNIDLSNNKKLKILKCYDCTLGNIDLSNNIELENLVLACCDGFSKLDLKNNTELRSLALFAFVSELDISKCKKLNSIGLQNTGIGQADISHCPNLVQCVRKGKKKTSTIFSGDVEYAYGKYFVYFTKGTKLYTGPVKKIVITNGEKATVMVGETLKLKTRFTPKVTTSKLTWSSSNKKVATVSSKGLVTAKSQGATTITVKTVNGKKATCKMTVKVGKE